MRHYRIGAGASEDERLVLASDDVESRATAESPPETAAAPGTEEERPARLWGGCLGKRRAIRVFGSRRERRMPSHPISASRRGSSSRPTDSR
jgi:hypothetical protein